MISDAVFEDVVQATQRLSPEQKSALLYRLQGEVETTEYPLTRERALVELQASRVAGAFARAQSLYGKYARPDIDLDSDVLQAAIREASTAGEAELE